MITDLKMYYMMQPNIRCGICHASVCSACANHNLMGSLYYPRQPISFIREIDANNRYDWAIS